MFYAVWPWVLHATDSLSVRPEVHTFDMWIFLVLTAIFLFTLHWLLSQPYDYWRRRGVPNPPPSMLAGNLGAAFILKKNIGQIYKDLYNEYKDYHYIGFYKVRKPAILLRDVDLIKEVLVKEFPSFHDNDIQVDEKVDPIFAKNPFVLTGHKWKVVRSQITSAITSGKMRSMHNLMLNVASTMVKYLEKEAPLNLENGLESKELSAKFTTDVVASCAFGLEAKCFEDPNSEFRRMGRKFLSPSFWMGIKSTLIFVFPWLSNILNMKLITDEVRDWFCGILFETIKYRETNNIVRNDYMDLMLSLKSKPGEYEFTNFDVVAQAMTFYADGFETSSIALSFALYELARNPDVQSKLRSEIDTVIQKHNGEFSYEAIQEMNYLDCVFSEALRKYPPGMFLAKVCTKQYTLPPPRGEGTGKSVTIDVGTPLAIPVSGIHWDPKHYPDPERFDPDRFSEENKKMRSKFCFLPFGEGPRQCLGQRFAVAQGKLALATIIHNFEIKVNKKMKEPIVLDMQYFMTCAKGGLWLNFYKIKK